MECVDPLKVVESSKNFRLKVQKTLDRISGERKKREQSDDSIRKKSNFGA
jgi:hypothetical protein